ncbi:WD domain-containing protein [Plasmodium falciparum RAJ116]|uniref:WD domain-containing protein n=1 Tax=Plasmodium falciparum RAJ116 TaxID=580058 RepID=A0A0L0D0T9_PLAFA|nr:WD domain-containing protein [Plasmodium falciparum RAJ116]
MIVGFNNGESCVYDYDIYNAKKIGKIQGKHDDNNKYSDIYKNVHGNTYTNSHNNNNNNNNCYYNDDDINDGVLCIDNNLDNKINIHDFQHNKSINQFYVNYHFNEPHTNEQTEKGINYLKWINSNLLLFTSLNGNIYIYDIRSRKCIHQFYSHTDTIFNVNLSLHLYQNKNILSILTASDDNSSNMHLLDISPYL